MAYTWEQIQNTDYYKNADEAGKASLKQQFDERFGTQTKTNSAPAPTPQPAKNLPSWEQIEATPAYQNASDEEKTELIRQYRERGGEYTPSTWESIKNNVSSGVGSFLAGTEQAIAGNVEAGANALGMKGVEQTVRNFDQGIQTDYKRNVVDVVKATGSGEAGLKYGEAAGDTAIQLGLDVVTLGRGGAVYQGLKEHGKTYAQTGSEAEALKAGGTAYAMNSIVPAVIGKSVATAAAKTGLGEVTEKALQLTGLSQKGVKAVTKGVAGATTGATTGAVLTGTQQGLDTYRETGSVTEAVKAGLEAAPTGAAIGAGLHVGGQAVATLAKGKQAITERALSGHRETLEKQQTTRAEALASGSTDQKIKAIQETPETSTVNAMNALNEHNSPISKSALNGMKSEQQMFGHKGDSKPIENNATKKQIVQGGRDLFRATNQGLETVTARMNNMKRTSDIGKKSVRDQDFNQFNNGFNGLKRAINKRDWATVNELAPIVDRQYSKLHPTDRAEIAKAFPGIKGVADDLDVLHIADTMMSADKLLSNQVENWRAAKPTTTTEDFFNAVKKRFTPTGIAARAAIHSVAPGATIPLEVAHTIGAPLVSKWRAGRQTAAQARRLEQLSTSNAPAGAELRAALQRNNHPEANNPDLTQAEAVRYLRGGEQETAQHQVEIPEGTQSFEQYGYKRNKQVQKQQIDDLKSQFSNPEVAEKVTASNYQNKEFIKELKSQDRATDIEKIKADAQNKSKAQAAKEEAAHTENMKEYNRFRSDEGSYLSGSEGGKDYLSEALAKHTTSTPSGERVLNISRIKADAQKAFDKETSDKTGKQAFAKELASIPDQTHRANLKSRIVDPLFANGKTPNTEQVKKAWNDLHTWKAEQYRKGGNESFAKKEEAQIKVKNDIIDNRVHSQQIDDFQSALKDSLKDSGLSERKINKFVNDETDSTFKTGKPLSPGEHGNAIKDALKRAEEFKKPKEAPKQSEEEPTFHQPKKPMDKEDAKVVEGHISKEMFDAINSDNPEQALQTVREMNEKFFGDDRAGSHAFNQALANAQEATRLKKAGIKNEDLMTREQIAQLSKGRSTHGHGYKTALVEKLTKRDYEQRTDLPRDLDHQISRIALYKTKAEVTKLFGAKAVAKAERELDFKFKEPEARKGAFSE